MCIRDRGEGGHDEVLGEYMAEGTLSPLMMIRRGPWKFVYSEQDPLLLFNLDNDPLERQNLAESSENKGILAGFLAEARERWDIPAIHAATPVSYTHLAAAWKASSRPWKAPTRWPKPSSVRRSCPRIT